MRSVCKCNKQSMCCNMLVIKSYINVREVYWTIERYVHITFPHPCYSKYGLWTLASPRLQSCEKCGTLVFNPDLQNYNLHFIKIAKWFICTLKFVICCSTSYQVKLHFVLFWTVLVAESLIPLISNTRFTLLNFFHSFIILS